MIGINIQQSGPGTERLIEIIKQSMQKGQLQVRDYSILSHLLGHVVVGLDPDTKQKIRYSLGKNRIKMAPNPSMHNDYHTRVGAVVQNIDELLLSEGLVYDPLKGTYIPIGTVD